MNIKGKAAIVCCSNGLASKDKEKFDQLKLKLTDLGLIPVFSNYIYKSDIIFNGSGKQRAKALMDFYNDDEIKVIFDISGGDIANEILPFLDFDVIKRKKKMFWGYSDLTTIINAIYTKTGNQSVLYQIRNIVYQDQDFYNQIFTFNYNFIQGKYLQGVVIGGNIRCLLKLAGTEYWPVMQDKILLLEARNGRSAQMITYLSQLNQIGVFKEIAGIILGTFIEMEAHQESIIDLVISYVGKDLPIIKTEQIGHNVNSKAIIIGSTVKYYNKAY